MFLMSEVPLQVSTSTSTLDLRMHVGVRVWGLEQRDMGSGLAHLTYICVWEYGFGVWGYGIRAEQLGYTGVPGS